MRLLFFVLGDLPPRWVLVRVMKYYFGFVSVTQECRPGLGNGPAGFELASGVTSCDVTPSARFVADVRRRHLVVTSSRRAPRKIDSVHTETLSTKTG